MVIQGVIKSGAIRVFTQDGLEAAKAHYLSSHFASTEGTGNPEYVFRLAIIYFLARVAKKVGYPLSQKDLLKASELSFDDGYQSMLKYATVSNDTKKAWAALFTAHYWDTVILRLPNLISANPSQEYEVKYKDFMEGFVWRRNTKGAKWKSFGWKGGAMAIGSLETMGAQLVDRV